MFFASALVAFGGLYVGTSNKAATSRSRRFLQLSGTSLVLGGSALLMSSVA